MKYALQILPLTLSVLLTTLACGRAQTTSDHTPTTSTNVFTLTCKVEGESLKCFIYNTSPRAVAYSSYTIGYFECVTLERWEAASKTWRQVSRTHADGFKGTGASLRDVKMAAPGALVPPEHFIGKPPGFTFTLNMNRFNYPHTSPQRLRVIQEMGTMLGRELPVWKGQLISNTVIYQK